MRCATSCALWWAACLAAHVPAAAAAETTCAAQESANPSLGNSLLQAGHSKIQIKDGALKLSEEGFTIHLFNSRAAQEKPDAVVVRPLFKKTYKCGSTQSHTCEECFGGEQCFEMREDADKFQYLYVEAKSRHWFQWKYHRVRVSFHCPEAAEFTMAALVTLNGWLSFADMKVDGQPARKKISKVRGRKRTMLLTKSWNSTKGTILELDLHFRLHRKGWAKVHDMVIRTSAEYLACQDHKTCLQELAKTEAGMVLRNDNTLQLMCLEGLLPGDAACEQWKQCLDSVGSTDRIRTLLLAAGVNCNGTNATGSGPSLAEALDDVAEFATDEVQAAEEVTQQSAGPVALLDLQGEEQKTDQAAQSCMDPRIDDPESWLCSCLDSMEETCLAVSTQFPPEEWSTQHCLTAQMCVDPLNQVCPEWKSAVGCNGTEYAALKSAIRGFIDGTGSEPAPPAEALLALRARRSRGRQAEGEGLDASLRGKASACE